MTMEKLPATVKLVEVGPRDGLQNEPATVPTADKIELIDRLSKTGLRHIETSSFVRADKIPQLNDAEHVFAGINRRIDIKYTALVPNEKGLTRALAAKVDEIAIFTAASETFNQKNINASITKSIERFLPVVELAQHNNLPVRGYISCALGCPYEGDIAPQAVVNVARRLDELGCYEISIGDTIGVGTPPQAQDLLRQLADVIAIENLAVHFHNTHGQALANIFACLQLGVSVVDASVAGLGGCPYADGATGNVATEDVVHMINELGIECGVDLDALLECAWFISDKLGRKPDSKVAIRNRPSLS
ncbi:MAG: hydroxymethylglutaryl-CoA lyase [Gammaproteobacteria bacterium]|nr:hydroxymethylglutaryl-CoA lyase [Gammaproteobacteria bacterium]